MSKTDPKMGRPPKPRSRRVRMVVFVTPAQAKWIDAERGTYTRSSFIVAELEHSREAK